MNEARIVYETEDGGVAVIIPNMECELSIEEIAKKDVPDGLTYKIVEASSIPKDRSFRGSWILSDNAVVHDIDKAKLIAHEMRRSMRSTELAPLDIDVTIPSKSKSAESAREIIREKYAFIQSAIEAASSISEIKAALAAKGV